jgi:hypothetical protein
MCLKSALALLNCLFLIGGTIANNEKITKLWLTVNRKTIVWESQLRSQTLVNIECGNLNCQNSNFLVLNITVTKTGFCDNMCISLSADDNVSCTILPLQKLVFAIICVLSLSTDDNVSCKLLYVIQVRYKRTNDLRYRSSLYGRIRFLRTKQRACWLLYTVCSRYKET